MSSSDRTTSADRVIMVGLNPAKGPMRRGCALDRSNEWLDILGLRFVSFVNLSSDPDWDFKRSTIEYDALKEAVDGYSIVLAWGGLPSDVLSKMGVDHFKLPHPSPRNRQLNDPEFVRSKLEECRRYLQKRYKYLDE